MSTVSEMLDDILSNGKQTDTFAALESFVNESITAVNDDLRASSPFAAFESFIVDSTESIDMTMPKEESPFEALESFINDSILFVESLGSTITDEPAKGSFAALESFIDDSIANIDSILAGADTSFASSALEQVGSYVNDDGTISSFADFEAAIESAISAMDDILANESAIGDVTATLHDFTPAEGCPVYGYLERVAQRINDESMTEEGCKELLENTRTELTKLDVNLTAINTAAVNYKEGSIDKNGLAEVVTPALQSIYDQCKCLNLVCPECTVNDLTDVMIDDLRYFFIKSIEMLNNKCGCAEGECTDTDEALEALLQSINESTEADADEALEALLHSIEASEEDEVDAILESLLEGSDSETDDDDVDSILESLMY